MTIINIPDSDDALLLECKIETFRSSGKGGQHANKTESAVRLTHEKSGIQVMCQDERSQHLNKVKCIKELRLRIKKKNYKPPRRIDLPAPVSPVMMDKPSENETDRSSINA